MSDSLVCPICDTTNEPGATNCEVCGERLTPLAEGEQLSPEENVSAMLYEEAGSLESDEPGEDAPDSGFFILDDEVEESGFATGFTVEPSEVDEENDAFAEPPSPPAAQPDVLYSPIDGSAYPAGTPEYEEGYGPLGEELVAKQPDITPPPSTTEVASESSIQAGFDIEGDDISEVDSFQPQFDEPVAEAPKKPVIEPLRTTPRQHQDIPAALPVPGVHTEPATLTIYQNRQPVQTHEVNSDELLIGRRDPIANAYPDIDVSEFDAAGQISRKHAYIYRQHKNYTLYVISNTGTQLNNELLELGQRRPLKDGDVIILAGKLAMKFHIPA